METEGGSNLQTLEEVCVLCGFLLLTSGVAVKQERVLQLKVQVFGDGLGQVFHTESVHDGKAVPGGCQPETNRAQKHLLALWPQ